jgi:hypothetical protein
MCGAFQRLPAAAFGEFQLQQGDSEKPKQPNFSGGAKVGGDSDENPFILCALDKVAAHACCVIHSPRSLRSPQWEWKWSGRGIAGDAADHAAAVHLADRAYGAAARNHHDFPSGAGHLDHSARPGDFGHRICLGSPVAGEV